MTTMEIAGELLRASADDRMLTYRLLPYTSGNTSVGKVLASAGCVTLPTNPADVVLNDRHISDRELGRGARMAWESDALIASFRINEGKAGDDLLDEAVRAKAGGSAGIELRASASVEIDHPVIRRGRLLGGLLTAAAAVVRPAFPSATLLAADAGELPDWMADTESESEATEEVVVDGVTYVRKTTSHYKTETTPKGQTDGDNAEQSAESEDDMGNTLTAAAAAAAGLQTHGTTTEQEPTAQEAFRMLASAFKQGGSVKQSKLLAALTNVVHDDGDNDGDGLGEIAAAPEWLGEVYKKAAYVRKYIPLVTQGNLTAYIQKGFNFGTLPVVAKYTGNKTDVPTGGMTATPVSYLVERWAHAADLDRRFVDFGDTEVLKAFVEAQVESYKKVTDVETLVDIIAAANTFVPGAVPSGISAVLAAIVDGALALIGADFNPTFAIVGSDIYRDYALTKKDQVPEYLASAAGLEVGSVDGFKIVPSSHANALGNVIVGDGSTVRFKELGGGAPIRVESEHIAQGGKDFGVFGYTSFQELIDGGVVKADITA